jgi:hypothetical protein
MKSARDLVSSLVLTCASVVLCLVAAEIALRAIDGYELTNASLVFRRDHEGSDRRQAFVQSVFARARRYAAGIKIDPSFQLEWYDASPPSPTDHKATFPLPADWAIAVEKATGREKKELRYWYNYNFVKKVCETEAHYDELAKFKTNPGFVYTFSGPDGTENPQFRYVPRGWDLGTASYNNFGFRGSDISYPKPPKTIRLAFLGFSTTENGWPWTYPDFIGQMLREWARSQGLDVDFDVINAGRAGVRSPGMARIMRYEVAPLQPDIIVIYPDGANLTTEAFGVVGVQPRSFNIPQLMHYSALAVRLGEFIAPAQGAGSEPAKPPHKLIFDLSQDVALERGDLPFSLHQEIADIRDVAQVSRAIGAEVFLASSVVLAHDGLQLDLRRHRPIFEELNVDSAPLTYAEIRRGVEFENRAYRALSEKDHLGFIEIDRYFPQDPDLFADTVHFSDEPGYRLQAWIMAQQLAPLIRDKLQKHELPRQAVADRDKIGWARQTPKKFDLSCLP